MDLQSAISRIDRYLSNGRTIPMIVDLPSKKDMIDLIDHYSTGAFDIVPASQYAAEDGEIKMEELLNGISSYTYSTFITGLSTFLKLHGETAVHNALKSLISKNTSAHIVILTYQCKRFLQFKNPKYKESGRILIVDGDIDTFPEVCLVPIDISVAFKNCYTGIEHISKAVELDNCNSVHIATNKQKTDYPQCVFQLSQMRNGYDILCAKDNRTLSVPSTVGTNEQWNKVLEIMGENGSWETIASHFFGSSHITTDFFQGYQSFDETKKWILYVLFLIFGPDNHPYLKKVIEAVSSYKDLLRSLFRTILMVDPKSPDFETLYKDRKSILALLCDATSEIIEYCKVTTVKGKDAIKYLTDLTQIEKECIITYLAQYGPGFSHNELKSLLYAVYPDLAMYLLTYQFGNDYLDKYFALYQYQKLTNHILPSFEVMVDEQAMKREFYKLLRSRTLFTDEMDVSDAHAYFMDAMGVEYLGYIREKCKQMGLSAGIHVARAELPTLTCFNKDFVETFLQKGCSVTDIKDLDEIKHHGEANYDYQKVKTPLHLVRELQIIDDVLDKIKANLISGNYLKAIMISDHGASRLAVLHETENQWSMATSGEHSGRCCPINEIDEKPACSIEAEEFWVLANYDRFKGGRKANVEVHGGASLEEIAVPIIEISLQKLTVEAFIIDESKEITLGPGEHAIIKIYVGANSSNISVIVNEKSYIAKATDTPYIFEADLTDILRKGTYALEILMGTESIATGQFVVKKKGMSENTLF